MKRKTFYFAGLLLALLVSLVSCTKITIEDIDDPDDPEIDQEYMAICKKAAEVYKQVLKIYDECSSIEDLEAQESKIRAIENVEDVYFTDISMFVDIKDFCTISYSFYPETEPINDEVQEELVKQVQALTTRASVENDETEHPLLNYQNAIIIDQQTKLQSGSTNWVSLINNIEYIFDEMGINTQVEDEPQIELFEEDIFKKDIVFIIAHGSYNPKKNLHWLCVTSKRIRYNDDDMITEPDGIFGEKILQYKGYINDEQVSVDVSRDFWGRKYISLDISENFISAQTECFENEGKAMVFNVACESLMGPGKKNDLRDTINYSFADAFIDRGAGVYLGYDATNWAGQVAGHCFFGRLLSCFSINNAYESLDPNCLHNNLEEQYLHQNSADLLVYPEGSIKNCCLTYPYILNYIDKSGDGNFSLMLKANAYQYILNVNHNIEKKTYTPYFTTGSFLTYGFVLSETEDFSSPIFLKGLYVGQDGCTIDNNSLLVSFQYRITDDNLKPNTKYYCKAFFNDGVSIYLSKNYKTFTTPKRQTDITGGGSLPDVPGTDF